MKEGRKHFVLSWQRLSLESTTAGRGQDTVALREHSNQVPFTSPSTLLTITTSSAVCSAVNIAILHAGEEVSGNASSVRADQHSASLEERTTVTAGLCGTKHPSKLHVSLKLSYPM